MGQLFGKPKARNDSSNPVTRTREHQRKEQQVSDKDKAVLDLKNARDRLKKYRKKLETESSQLTDQAKELIRAQQRDRALLLLKLRKHKEKAVNQINDQLITVMQQIEDVEWTLISVQVFDAIKSGTNLLNKIHEEISVESVQSLLEETNEAIEVENQINAVLAGQITQIEETDLLDELNQLMAQHAQPVADRKDVEVSNVILSMPEAPTGKITVFPAAPDHDIIIKEEEAAEAAVAA